MMMTRSSVLALLLLAPVTGAAPRQPQLQTPAQAPRAYPLRPGVISVRFLADTRSEVLALPALSGASILRENRLGIVDLELPAGADGVTIAAELTASGLVEFAEVDSIGEWFGGPDDTDFGLQWHLENTGQTGGVAGADVGALEAWDVTTGDASIITAVLDSGTELTHPDLAPNLWVNPGEVPGNGVDDDGNGLVDDVNGWDFEGNDNDLSSQVGHGTQTAGVLGARTNDGTGIASLAGGYGATPGCSMIATKVGTFGPITSLVDDAILYAMDEGARVINMSFGINTSSAVDAALEAAHAAGVVLVVASGNSGGQTVFYPASHPRTIAVGASDHTDSVASFSTGGTALDLVAPGANIRTTSFFGGYSNASGTSFSSPLVASAVALLLSLDPSLGPEDVRSALHASCVDLGPPGFNPNSGFGRLEVPALLAPYAGCTGASYCTSTANSSGLPATISYSGSLSVGANDLVLEAQNCSSSPTPGLFYYGTQAVSLPFGNGTRCVGGTVQRLPVLVTSALGSASYAVDITSPPQSTGQISAGETWYFQFWFRDPAAGGSFFDLSNALELTFCD